MSTTTTDTTAAETSETFDVFNPGTGDIVGTYPIDGPAEVDAAVGRAHEAAAWWASLSFAERGRRIDAFRGIIARRFAYLSKLVAEETGKPVGDASLEIATVLDHMAWATKNAEKILGRQTRKSSLMSFHLKGTVEYRPLGVVGVIGPWNFPVMTPLGSIIFALAAGNAVVFKPSEFTPGVGQWLAKYFAEAVPEHSVLQVVTGDGRTGDALVRSNVDKVAFTGSTATAKKVMAACAESLTPIVAECGGKDALVVDYDADVDAAVDAAAWASLANAGQICVGTERLFVHSRIYDEFTSKLAAKVNGLRAGTDPSAKIGPITMPSQLEIIGRHVREALAAGATVLAGGVSDPDGQVVQPVILENVPEDAEAMQHETFGPTATVTRFDSVEEVLAKVNGTAYGLGGTVFGRKRAEEIARGMRSGMVSINVILGFAQVPTMPFGGVGDSGFGRIHGPEGLREFSYAQSVVRRRLPSPLDVTTFKRTGKQDTLLATVVNLMHGNA
jgi:acyl-CoA reductase-like NAD-dependent aldehyde dehydrogenase